MKKTKHLRSLFDLGGDGIAEVLKRAAWFKAHRGQSDHPRPLAGRSVAIVLEKASTRTRVSFEVGVHELGGLPITLLSRDVQLSRGEPIEDTAKTLSGYVHAIVYRTFEQANVERMAAAGSVPVINALTDKFHPCQILADLQTVQANLGRVKDIRVAWIGDANNVANCWMVAAKLLGFEVVVAAPSGYKPVDEILDATRGHVTVVDDPAEAARGAHVVTTDVWASMGQETETADRKAAFKGFCVTPEVMKLADSKAIFLHCLPAHRGEEVTADVIDGGQSRVWEEAENRLHAQKAVLELLTS